MKRFLSLLLAVLMVTTMSATAFAADSQFKQKGEVLTAATPEKILNIAKDEITDMLSAHLEASQSFKTSSSNTEKDIYSRSYTLGQPINLKENGSTNRIYDFPVMRDGKIFAIFTIYDDCGEISLQLEECMMAMQLQELKEQGLLENATFASNDDGFFILTKDSIFPLTPDSNLESTKRADNKTAATDNSGDTLAVLPANITEPIMNITVSDSSKDTKEITSKVLSVTSVPQTNDGTFNGTQMNWCGAAVTAAIINYKKGTSLTAKSVTIEALGSALDQGITNAQVVSVGKNHGLAPKSGNPLSYSSVKTEINGNRPVYMQMQRTENGEKKYHALGLIGYSSTKYTIINPWYQNSLTIDKKNTGSDVTYVTGTRIYKWYKSVYNWK